MLARFDIRGSGLSDRTGGDVGLDAWVRDIEAVADDLGWPRFPILGLCQGGAVAIAYAVRHPERVSRLVLCNSYVQGAFTDGVDEKAARQADALGRMIQVGWGRSTPAFRDVFARLLTPEADAKQLCR
jgi:pimeloyl-ACP methyl ester carboxylesterase